MSLKMVKVLLILGIVLAVLSFFGNGNVSHATIFDTILAPQNVTSLNGRLFACDKFPDVSTPDPECDDNFAEYTLPKEKMIIVSMHHVSDTVNYSPISNPVNWNSLGTYTGFNIPAPDRLTFQRGIKNTTDYSAIQMQGTQVGLFLNTWLYDDYCGVHGCSGLRYEYNFRNTDISPTDPNDYKLFPWRTSDTALVLQGDLQIPWMHRESTTAFPQVSFTFFLKEDIGQNGGTTDRTLHYVILLYDTRCNITPSNPAIDECNPGIRTPTNTFDERVEYDSSTGVNYASTFVMPGTVFATKSQWSAGSSRSTLLPNPTFYRVLIKQENLTLFITELNKKINASGGTPFSTTLSNYRISGVNLLVEEITVEDEEELSIGTSLNNFTVLICSNNDNC
jgi:hypothetical protein